MSRGAVDSPPSLQLLTPAERASCDRIVRGVERGELLTVLPVPRPEVGNRILEATGEVLTNRGFLMVIVDGSEKEAMRKAWRSIATARREAARTNALRPTALVVRDAHMLRPGQLDLLAQAGNLAVIAAPRVPGAAPPGAARRRWLWLSAPAAASVVAVALGWSAIEHAATPMPADAATAASARPSSPAPGPAAAPSAETGQSDTAAAPRAAGGAPGLLLKAGPGDTLKTLYLQVYRGTTAPPFEDVEALNPEPIREGAIVAFPAPHGAWDGQDGQ